MPRPIPTWTRIRLLPPAPPLFAFFVNLKQRKPDQSFINPIVVAPSFFSTPLRTLQTCEDAPLMLNVTREATRDYDPRRQSSVQPCQAYLFSSCIASQKACGRIYATTSEQLPSKPPLQCVTAFSVVPLRDGVLIAHVPQGGNGSSPLVKVVRRADTSTRLMRSFCGSQIIWSLQNYGLYQDLRDGTEIAILEDTLPRRRHLSPALAVRMPRLEIMACNETPDCFLLMVGNVDAPVGRVKLVHFSGKHSTELFLHVNINHCTREESVIWLSMLVCGDRNKNLWNRF